MKKDIIDELKNEREYWRTRIFRLLLEIAIIFALPAVAAVLLGGWVEGEDGSRNSATFLFLGIAFVFSWVIVILRYRSVKKRLDEVEDSIKNFSNERSSDLPEK